MSDSEFPAEVLGPTPACAEKVFGERLTLAEDYASILSSKGIERGLIGPREIGRIWERHVLNSAVLGEAIPHGARVIDVGSGAGLPGIPLSIARPDLDVILLEPLLRRTRFLDEVSAELGLSVRVVRGRAEDGDIVRSIGGAEVVTSRAVAPLGKLAAWSLPLVKVGGSMRALKGASVSEEIERDAQQIARSGGGKASVELVGESVLEEPTHVVVIPRVS